MPRQTKAEKQAYAARRAAQLAENIRIVQTGKCPQCGSKLRRNLALTGWWVCEQRGAVGFRADASKPECSFDCFTA